MGSFVNNIGHVHGHVFNVDGDLHFHAGQTKEEFAADLIKLREAVERAIQAQALDANAAQAAQLLDQACTETQKDTPDQKTLFERLKQASQLLQTSAKTGEAVAKIATWAGSAYAIAQAIFT